jgi:catalase
MSDPALGDRLVEAIHLVAGTFPGHRALHAKGTVARGTFRATGAGGALTTAAHLAEGADVPVTVRFSNGSADPHAPDAARDGRGMSTRFHLPDGSSTDIVALTLPVFFVRTPEDFLAFMAARIPDPATGQPDLAKVIAFIGEHPEAQQAVELSMGAPIPESYACTRYFAIHAFWFVAPDGRRTPIRYRWEPDAGVLVLDETTAAERSPDFLAEELDARLAEGPVGFSLHLQVGTHDDDTTDPTTEWPETRDDIVVGHLVLREPVDQVQGEALIFDPTRVTTGIECGDDAILHARSQAYSSSYALRQG